MNRDLGKNLDDSGFLNVSAYVNVNHFNDDENDLIRQDSSIAGIRMQKGKRMDNRKLSDEEEYEDSDYNKNLGKRMIEGGHGYENRLLDDTLDLSRIESISRQPSVT